MAGPGHRIRGRSTAHGIDGHPGRPQANQLHDGARQVARPEQVEANRAQWARIQAALPKAELKAPKDSQPDETPIQEHGGFQVKRDRRVGSVEWVEGDCLEELDCETNESFDLVWTCPPYFNLERYSKDERDGSNFEHYGDFKKWYYQVLERCYAQLRENRFMGIVVGEVRSPYKKGPYVGLVADTVKLAQAAGFSLYNEAVYVTPMGTLPIRCGPHFRGSRKLGKGHQNVLWFYKGDTDTIKATFPDDIQVGDVAETTREE